MDENKMDEIENAVRYLQDMKDKQQLPYEDIPVRLMQTPAGQMLRILDHHNTPLSNEMLKAIDAFTIKKSSLIVDEDQEITTSKRRRLEANHIKELENNDIEVQNDVSCVQDLTQDSDTDVQMDDFVDTTGLIEIDKTNVSVNTEKTQSHVDYESISIATEETLESMQTENSIPPATDTSSPLEEVSQSCKEILQPINLCESDSLKPDLERPGEVNYPPAHASLQVKVKIPSDDSLGNELLANHEATTSTNICTIIQPSTEQHNINPIDVMQYAQELYPLRTRECLKPTVESYDSSMKSGIVLYWLRHCLRVSHGNFGLSAAQSTAKKFQLPLAVIMFLPSFLQLPITHCRKTDDAALHFSILHVYKELKVAGIPVIAFHEVSELDKLKDIQNILNCIEILSPSILLTDDSCDIHSRSQLQTIVTTWKESRNSKVFPILAIDSMTGISLYRSSMSLCDSLCDSADDDSLFSEVKFNEQYSAAIQNSDGQDSASGPKSGMNNEGQYIGGIVNSRHTTDQAEELKQCIDQLKTLEFEPVHWKILEYNTQEILKALGTNINSMDPSKFTEGHACKALEGLLQQATLTSSNPNANQPAIQQELYGSGILSLMPFIRHGSLFSCYVLEKIDAAISTFSSSGKHPARQKRKALANLKVFRSRAITHLLQDRDYVLYTSLWCSKRVELRNMWIYGETIPSTLDMYSLLLPKSINANNYRNASFEAATCYEPRVWEQGLTDNEYWNEIQSFLQRYGYMHPVLTLYWVVGILKRSETLRAALALLEGLLYSCALGNVQNSPDFILSIWKTIFQFGEKSTTTSFPQSWQELLTSLDTVLSSQTRLKLS